MKIPSLLRTPKYQRFHVEPRYYDPVKEELKKREEHIKRIMLADKEELNGQKRVHDSTLHGSFTKRRSTKGGSASFAQLIIMFLLTSLIFGYIYLGDVALYVVLLISSVLLYFKMKRRL